MNSAQIPPTKSRGLVKNILLMVLTFLSMMFFAFGYIQKIEADKQRAIAVAAMEEANKQRMEAEKMRLTAKYQEMEARKQAASAEEALAACQKSKKK